MRKWWVAISTIYEVAQKAGVSVATASRALNDSGYVSRESRDRVLAAAKALDYHINVNARSLTSGKTYTIALVLPDVTNPFFPAVARGVEDYASDNGYCVILCNTDGNARKESDYVRMLRSRKVDGVIFAVSVASKSRVSALTDDGIAVVLVDRDLGDSCDIVKTDNIAGALLATNHLIGLGHTSIAFISGPMSLATSQERFRGYHDALVSGGVSFDERLVVEGDFRMKSGYEAMRDLLRKPCQFTAVFAANDLMAVGAMTALEESGFHVPTDVAVMGYDDIDIASVTRPRLSTVAQPKYEMGWIAAETVIRRMCNPKASRLEELLQPMLVVRDSTVERRGASV
ncbi:MAG: LacI family DNA-binding transcriptional regulator [Bacillota bacterium]